MFYAVNQGCGPGVLEWEVKGKCGGPELGKPLGTAAGSGCHACQQCE